MVVAYDVSTQEILADFWQATLTPYLFPAVYKRLL
jgi:hypothetical protein